MDKFDFKNNNPVNLASLQIKGDRLFLSSISDRYCEEIFKEFSHEITRYMGPKPAGKIEETLSFLADALNGMKAGNDLTLAVTKRNDGEFLGCCGLHGKGNTRAPELGVWIKKNAHGNKYGQEAVHALTLWAVETIDFDYLVYPVDKANIASRKIPESLGAVIFEEKTVPTMRGTFLDLVVYKMTYEALKQKPKLLRTLNIGHL